MIAWFEFEFMYRRTCGPRDRSFRHGVNKSAFDARVITGPTRSFEFSIRIFTSLHRINLELT